MAKIKIDSVFQDFKKEEILSKHGSKIHIDRDEKSIEDFILKNEFIKEPKNFKYKILSIVTSINKSKSKYKTKEAIGFIIDDDLGCLISASWFQNGLCYIGNENDEEYNLCV